MSFVGRIVIFCLWFFRIAGQYSLAMTLLSESVPMAKRNLVVMLVTSIFLLSQGVIAGEYLLIPSFVRALVRQSTKVDKPNILPCFSVLAMPIIPQTFSYYIPFLGINWTSWRLLLLIYSLPSLATALWLSFMQESPKFVYSKGDAQKAVDILRTIYEINYRRTINEFQVSNALILKNFLILRTD